MGGGCSTEAPHSIVVVKAWEGDGSKGALSYPELSPEGDYGIPALQAKPNFGICISGGGMRAATTGLGAVRALHSLGMLTPARYLSSTSGGSWLNGPLSFGRHVSSGAFLGEYVPPEMMTMESLCEDHLGPAGESFMAALTNKAPMADLAVEIVKDFVLGDWYKSRARAWTESIAGSFLKPFGLDDLRTSTATALGTRGAVDLASQKTADKLGLKAVYKYDGNGPLPYPIITECILEPKDPAKFFPAEWTPLYNGVPAAITAATGAKFGSGWVENIGANSRLLSKKAKKGKSLDDDGFDATLEVRGPSSLGQAVGISSGYIPLLLGLGKNNKEKSENKLIGSATMDFWDFETGSSREVEWADGGGTDYLGIHPLLRRKVARIVSWAAVSRDPNDDNDWSSKYEAGPAGLFGCWNGGIQYHVEADVFNKNRKVFSSEGFDALWADVKAKHAAGGPLWHLGKYQVLTNEFLGIQGGWEVEILWIFNGGSTKWIEALPQETRDYLAEERNSKLDKLKGKLMMDPFLPEGVAQMPLVDTNCMVYSPELVLMLSNHAAWTVTQAIQESGFAL